MAEKAVVAAAYRPGPALCARRGNVYCGGSGGIWIMDPSGKKLGRIVDGQPATTNMAFGGDDWKTLLFTSRSGGRDKDLEVCLEDGDSIDVPVRCAACV